MTWIEVFDGKDLPVFWLNDPERQVSIEGVTTENESPRRTGGGKKSVQHRIAP